MFNKKRKKDNSNVEHNLYNILRIFGFICIGGFILSIVIFVVNHAITSYICMKAVSEITKSNELVKQSIDFLEKIQLIQESIKTNDVMSFIYSAVSSALIGLGVGLVANIYKNSEIAKESANNAKNAASSATEAANSYNDFVSDQDILYKTQSVYNEITLARVLLLNRDQYEANVKIKQIKNRIKTIDFTSKNNAIYLNQLIKELKYLKKTVSVYEHSVVNDENTEEKKKISAKNAVKNYSMWIEEAIAHCENKIKKD